MTDLHDIFNEWQKNLKFREEFKKNPVEACKNAGFDVSPELLAKIEATLKLKNSDSKDEELDDRISK